MIRTKGEAGSGDIVEAVRHLRAVQRGIRTRTILDREHVTVETTWGPVRVKVGRLTCIRAAAASCFKPE